MLKQEVISRTLANYFASDGGGLALLAHFDPLPSPN
jgi:hypothetical protein